MMVSKLIPFSLQLDISRDSKLAC